MYLQDYRSLECSLLDPTQIFGELFRSVQAGKYAVVKTSTQLAAAVLRDSMIQRLVNNE